MNIQISNSLPLHSDHDVQIGVMKESGIQQHLESFYELAKTVVLKVKTLERETKTILVVDEAPLTFRQVEEPVENSNFDCQIIPALSGEEAYKLAIMLTPDLIIVTY